MVPDANDIINYLQQLILGNIVKYKVTLVVPPPPIRLMESVEYLIHFLWILQANGVTLQ